MKRIVAQVLVGASLLLSALSSFASPEKPQLGVEYQLAKRPQPADSGKKVEITEFFGYFCPHCYQLEPLLEAWAKKNADKVTIKRQHSNMHGLVSQQKLFFTLDIMGKVDEYQMKVFDAFHLERNRLVTDADVMNFVSRSGLDKNKFAETYNNAFTMQTKINRANQLAEIYQLDGVPTFVVDGRYITSPAMSVAAIGRTSEEQQNRAGLMVLDFLVDKILKERNGTAPAAKAEPAKAEPAKKK